MAEWEKKLQKKRQKKREKHHQVNILDYLEDGEQIQTMIRYDYPLYPLIKRTTILGLTNARSFMYRRSGYKKRFVSSNRSFSHMEYGFWKMPIWMWILLAVSFVGPLSLLSQGMSEYLGLAIGMIIFPLILTLVCIRFRKFNYIGTAIGMEFIHIMCRKGSFIGDITEFLKKIHVKKPFGRPETERYVIPNYFTKRIRRFIVIFAIISLLTAMVKVDDSLELWGI